MIFITLPILIAAIILSVYALASAIKAKDNLLRVNTLMEQKDKLLERKDRDIVQLEDKVVRLREALEQEQEQKEAMRPSGLLPADVLALGDEDARENYTKNDFIAALDGAGFDAIDQERVLEKLTRPSEEL
jgi:hypothetical protein